MIISRYIDLISRHIEIISRHIEIISRQNGKILIFMFLIVVIISRNIEIISRQNKINFFYCFTVPNSRDNKIYRDIKSIYRAIKSTI